MPAPIDKIGAKVIAPAQTDIKSGPGATNFRVPRKDTQLPPLKEIGAAEQKNIERDLRKRLERAQSQDAQKLFGADMKDLRMKLDTVSRVEAPGIKDRLTAIESQYTSAENMLKNIPDTNNLRDLLAMQTEMYKMSHNIEILSKVVDAASSGIKQTLQTQV